MSSAYGFGPAHGNCYTKQPIHGSFDATRFFFNFKSAAEKTLNTTNLKISKAQWIRISKDDPGQVKIRETLNELDAWKVTKVFKKNINTQSIKTMNLEPLECTSRISEEKKDEFKNDAAIH